MSELVDLGVKVLVSPRAEGKPGVFVMVSYVGDPVPVYIDAEDIGGPVAVISVPDERVVSTRTGGARHLARRREGDDSWETLCGRGPLGLIGVTGDVDCRLCLGRWLE